jgi:hypothetical protein
MPDVDTEDAMSRPFAPGRIAVEAYLRVNVGTTREISAATGVSMKRVQNIVKELKWIGSPLLENLMKIREESDPKPDAGQIVAMALASLTPLEQCWR